MILLYFSSTKENNFKFCLSKLPIKAGSSSATEIILMLFMFLRYVLPAFGISCCHKLMIPVHLK